MLSPTRSKRKPSSKQSIQKDLDKYKAEKATVEYPDGSKQKYTFEQLEETYNDLKDQRAKLNAELGDTAQAGHRRPRLRWMSTSTTTWST